MAVPQNVLHGFDMSDWCRCGAGRLNPRPSGRRRRWWPSDRCAVCESVDVVPADGSVGKACLLIRPLFPHVGASLTRLSVRWDPQTSLTKSDAASCISEALWNTFRAMRATRLHLQESLKRPECNAPRLILWYIRHRCAKSLLHTYSKLFMSVACSLWKRDKTKLLFIWLLVANSLQSAVFSGNPKTSNVSWWFSIFFHQRPLSLCFRKVKPGEQP